MKEYIMDGTLSQLSSRRFRQCGDRLGSDDKFFENLAEMKLRIISLVMYEENN